MKLILILTIFITGFSSVSKKQEQSTQKPNAKSEENIKVKYFHVGKGEEEFEFDWKLEEVKK